MSFSEVKKEARKNIKNNYFKNVIVVFVCTLLLSGGISLSTKNMLNVDLTNNKHIKVLTEKTHSEIIYEILQKTLEEKEYEKIIASKFNRGILSTVINEVASTRSFMFSFVNSLNNFLGGNLSIAIMIIIANFMLFIIQTFFLNVFAIGRSRYFLEQRRYLKANIDRILFAYKKKRTFKLSIILLLKNIYLFLWAFTIVGFFIKYYEYKMIPYILAENPYIGRKEAFRLSKELTKGNKFKLFKLDLSLLGWKLLGYLTLNILNVFYTNIYKQTVYSEVYANLRNERLNELTNKELLNDKELFIDDKVNDHYKDGSIKRNNLFNINYNKDYTIVTYILLFFTFSFIGWSWEVLFHLINYGSLVNRGTLYGPWLPIYGWGGVLVLVLLKRYRKNPYKMFISSLILCGIIEYFTGWFLETVKHVRYWDYYGYFLNINGRVCLEGLIVFGLAGCGFTYIFAPVFDNLYSKININIKKVVATILVIFFVFDNYYSSFINPNIGEGITSEIQEKIETG